MFGGEYLHWFKTRRPARYSLATSGVLPCSLADLNLDRDSLEIDGPALYGYEPLQQAIAEHCRVPAESIVTAFGASMANFIAMAVLIQRGDEVLIEQPVYEPLLDLAAYCGAQIRRWPRELPLRDFVSDRTRLIVVTNLHNPSCERLTAEQLEDLADAAARSGARVLVDEVYLECLYEERSSAFRGGPQFICTSSLTKAYGLGGLRCGWILAPPDLAQRMWRMKDLIDPGAPRATEQLSVAAFRNLNRLAVRAKALIHANRSALLEWLPSQPRLQLSAPPYGTCVFPKLVSGDVDRLSEVLHERYDVDVVPGRFFGMSDHFRVGIGGDAAVFISGLERLGAALSQAPQL